MLCVAYRLDTRVVVTGGFIAVGFTRIVENPLVCGIEILRHI
jgi:hypothetical protein